MTDLSAIKPAAYGVLKLLAPGSSKELGLSLHILPAEHESIKKEVRKIRDRQRFLTTRNRPTTTADEERIAKEISLVATVDWVWTDKDANWEGEQPAFDKTILADLIERDWIREQIDNFLADAKNFFTV